MAAAGQISGETLPVGSRQKVRRIGRPGGLAIAPDNQALAVANHQKPPFDCVVENVGVANPPDPSANENPGALAGATGANSKAVSFKTLEYRNRAERATTLCMAIADCHRDDAVRLLAAALEDLAFGSPLPSLINAMAAARWWASYATEDERKAYCLASFDAMSQTAQSAFLAHVQGRAAA